MKIYLSCDRNCWKKDRIVAKMLGGTELFFLILRDWLIEEGYDVFDPVLTPPFFREKFDLAIHSNYFDNSVDAKKHILWAGSWHAQGHEHVDKTIVVSEFFKNKMGWDEAVVIPAPFSKDVRKYERSLIKGRIVCTSNPNRFLPHAIEICKVLDKTGIDYEYIISGGNKLYGESFGESVSFEQYSHPRLHYRGPLTRQELFALLGTAHLWVYPNLSSKDETLCVAMLESAALGIPTIVANREPFISVLPEAIFANDVLEFADKIIECMKFESIDYDNISRYSEELIRPQFMEVIGGLLT